MEKFMKGCAITALVLVVVGAALAIVCSSLQGRAKMQEIVDNVTDGKLKINLGRDAGVYGVEIGDETLGSILEGGEVLYDFDENDVKKLFNKKYAVHSGTVEKYSLGKDIRKLEIEAGGCSLEAKESEDDSFWVEASGIGKLQCYAEDGTLYVKSTRSGKGKVGLSKIRASQIVLYVPTGYSFDKVSVDLGAGELNFDNLCGREIKLEVGAGQIVSKNLKGEEVELEIGMGGIQLEAMQADELTAQVGMGNLDLDGTILKKADLECSMGNLTCKIDGSKKDFDYELECSMGSIDLDGEEYTGLAKKQTIDNDAEKKINVECSMGAVEISFR